MIRFCRDSIRAHAARLGDDARGALVKIGNARAGYRHHASLWPRPGLAVARHIYDQRILENRDIVVDRLLGVIVEPKHRRYFLCARLPFALLGCARRSRGPVSISRAITEHQLALALLLFLSAFGAYRFE
jgi:hypothetical protein